MTPEQLAAIRERAERVALEPVPKLGYPHSERLLRAIALSADVSALLAERDALRAHAEALAKALGDAESKLRSAHLVAGKYVLGERDVADTNWAALRDRLREALTLAHIALAAYRAEHPEGK